MRRQPHHQTLHHRAQQSNQQQAQLQIPQDTQPKHGDHGEIVSLAAMLQEMLITWQRMSVGAGSPTAHVSQTLITGARVIIMNTKWRDAMLTVCLMKSVALQQQSRPSLRVRFPPSSQRRHQPRSQHLNPQLLFRPRSQQPATRAQLQLYRPQQTQLVGSCLTL